MKTWEQVSEEMQKNGTPLSALGYCKIAFDDGRKDTMPISLEKQYAERMGRIAQLCDTVIPWVLGPVTDGVAIPKEVRSAMGEIMDYVDEVRP